ncbi:MAG TPA: response regulator [Caulobacteraceae bacterium]|jgi:two-component system KDP operon response regulator KdpE
MSASHPRVLVVDDEPQIHRFLAPALEAAGYIPLRAETGEAGLTALATRPPDVLVLDLGLPDLDGKVVLERARRFFDGPIIILSARDEEIEKIDALDQGADDYVEKPFGVGELLARIRASLRNKASRTAGSPIVHAGEVEIDFVRRLVTRSGEIVRLTPREYDVLVALAEAGGRVITHGQLLTAVWGRSHVEDVQYLRIIIQRLRQKLEADPTQPKTIITEARVGYRFVGD